MNPAIIPRSAQPVQCHTLMRHACGNTARKGFTTKQQARKSEGHGAGKIGRFARRITFGVRVPSVAASAVIARVARSPIKDTHHLSQWDYTCMTAANAVAVIVDGHQSARAQVFGYS